MVVTFNGCGSGDKKDSCYIRSISILTIYDLEMIVYDIILIKCVKIFKVKKLYLLL